MVDWKDVENESSSNFLKLVEGRTELEVVGEPKKVVDKYGNTKYKFSVFANQDRSKQLEWSASPMIMQAIGSCLGKPETLHGKTFIVIREGLTKENTKYTIKKVAEEVQQ